MTRLSSTALRRLAIALALSTPALGLISLEARSATPATSVQIKNFAFMSQPLTVKVGTTVTWTNSDDDPHTVTATDKSFRSAALDTDDKYSFTFTKPGEYAYFCSLHPHMTGKIIVKA
jgi:plastocyanin